MLDEVHIQNIQFPDNDVISNNKYPVKQKRNRHYIIVVHCSEYGY